MRNPSGSGRTRETLRIIAAVALPGFALFLFSGAFVLDHWRVANEMKRIETLASLASEIGSAVHELQVERGLSALHSSAEHKEFETSLYSQRKRCDVEMEKLRTSLIGFDFESYPDAISFHAKDVISQMTGLDGLRRSHDRGETSPEGTIENYSGLVAALLRLVEEMSLTTTSPLVPRSLTAYINVLKAKERAGQERALGGIGFAMGGFTEVESRHFASLIDAQETYLDQFHAGASSQQRALLQKQLESEATRRVDELRRMALASVGNGDTRQIDPVIWFDAATLRIVELKGLEDHANADVAELTSEIARTALTRLSIMSLGLVALSVALVWTLLRELQARKRAHQNLAESRAQFDEITANASDAIITIDHQGLIRFWNPAAQRILGYTANEVLGRNVSLVIPERFRAAHAVGLQRLIETGIPRVTEPIEVAAVTKGAGELEVELSLANWTTARGPVFAAIGRDVSERRRTEDQIRALAYYDVLTGFPNRKLFRDKLEDAFASAKREKRSMALLFLDLDHFKQVNDTLGHNVGDRLLSMVAERLLTHVRTDDWIARCEGNDSSIVLSRLGGDEFTILLSNLSDRQNAALVAQRVLGVLREPFAIEETEVFATASIGVAVFPLDGEDVDTLLMNADAAMYCAKENGGNEYRFFSKSMNVAAKRKLEIVSRLRHALERDEFSLCYQPLRDTVSGKTIGAEALLRWEASELGSVAPAEFIPIAEETGLIAAIGEWVLRTACVQAQAWRDAGFQPIRMAVNLSGQQLRDSSFVETVAEILQESGLSSAYLELEITESSIIQNENLAAVILRNLHECGIAIVLDDFGTGYSSLSYLRRFPISRVKIDRSFVSQLPADPDDAALTSAIIAMAHSLRLTVIGEGVETLEQAEFLRELGCDTLQGHLFSPAVPAEEFVRFLEQEKRE